MLDCSSPTPMKYRRLHDPRAMVHGSDTLVPMVASSGPETTSTRIPSHSAVHSSGACLYRVKKEGDGSKTGRTDAGK